MDEAEIHMAYIQVLVMLVVAQYITMEILEQVLEILEPHLD